MLKNKDDKVTVMAIPGQGPDNPIRVCFTDPKLIGNGSFGCVYRACLLKSGEIVAIKKVAQDKRFVNRELTIMRKLNHCNIVKLKYFYYSKKEKEQTYLNLILEYFPDTLFSVFNRYHKAKQTLPLPCIKLYTYQLFRSLAYLHSIGICHRDIKPQNLLLSVQKGVLKLCDFGSAKLLDKGSPNVSYICSRYYRAPELLFGATHYTSAIDIWSAGCVLAELILGRTIFLSDNSVEQLVEIIKVLGTPTTEEIELMNKDYAKYKYPYIGPESWSKVLKNKATPDAIDLISQLLVYIPSARLNPLQACAHKFFDHLRESSTRFQNNRDLHLFNFSEHELKIQPDLNDILIPPHLRNYVYSGIEACSANDTMIETSNSIPIDSATLVTQPNILVIL